jgi:hypothetical protein
VTGSLAIERDGQKLQNADGQGLNFYKGNIFFKMVYVSPATFRA